MVRRQSKRLAAKAKAKTPRAPRDRGTEKRGVSNNQTGTLPDYAPWMAQAGAELQRRHDIKAATIPPRVWTRLFIKGLSPEQAAEQAAVSAYNTRSPGDQLRTPRR